MCRFDRSLFRWEWIFFAVELMDFRRIEERLLEEAESFQGVNGVTGVGLAFVYDVASGAALVPFEVVDEEHERPRLQPCPMPHPRHVQAVLPVGNLGHRRSDECSGGDPQERLAPGFASRDPEPRDQNDERAR